MAKGGKRLGAGRKRGSATKRTREIAERAAEEGVTPLEVMLTAMKNAVAANDYETAARYAKDAAPYCHPRLASVEHGGKDGGAIIVKIIRYAGDHASEQLAPAPLSNGSVGLPRERRH